VKTDIIFPAGFFVRVRERDNRSTWSKVRVFFNCTIARDVWFKSLP